MQNEQRLIDANALPNYKCQVTATIGDRKGPAEMRFVFWQDIEKAPTISAVPVVHGRWIEHPDDRCSLFNGWECSECKQIVSGGRGNYCPNCGAKMDAKELDVPTKDGGAD